MNLLEETIGELKENGKSEDDVVWIGTKDIKISWDNFKEIADVNYDAGFGSSKVAGDLLIVGKGFWMERCEYDGSEWWEFRMAPAEPKETVKIKALTIQQAKDNGF